MCLLKLQKRKNNMQFCQCDLHKASNIAVGRLKNTIDLTKGSLDPKFFGKWAWPLIFNETLSPYILRESLDYIKTELDDKGIAYDNDDFHFHLAYIYLIFRDYSQAIKELELIGFSNIAQTTASWKSFSSLISNAFQNYIQSSCYSSTIVFTNHPTETQRISFIESNYGTEYVLIKIRWQMAVRFWNDIAVSDAAYSECLSTVEFTAIFFERCLFDACRRLGLSSSLNMIYELVHGNSRRHLQGLIANKGWSTSLESSLQQSYPANTISLLNSNFNSIKTQISTCGTFGDYAVTLLYLCRVIRNNCSHKMDLSHKLFTTSDELKQYVSVLHEGILLTAAL